MYIHRMQITVKNNIILYFIYVQVLHFYVFLKTNVRVSLILFLLIWKSAAIMYLVVMIYNKNHVCLQVFRCRVLGLEFLRMSFLVFCFLMVSTVVCYFLSAVYQLYDVAYNRHTNSVVSWWFPIFPVVPFGP